MPTASSRCGARAHAGHECWRQILRLCGMQLQAVLKAIMSTDSTKHIIRTSLWCPQRFPLLSPQEDVVTNGGEQKTLLRMKCRFEPMDHNANLDISVEEGKNMKHPVTCVVCESSTGPVESRNRARSSLSHRCSQSESLGSRLAVPGQQLLATKARNTQARPTNTNMNCD